MRKAQQINECRQCVVVQSNSSRVALRFYERHGMQWRECRDLRANGVCGRGGVRANKREGDGCTPRGLFPIGDAFYIGEEPHTNLRLWPITPDMYWVDDPMSPLYNRLIHSTEKPPVHAEHMIDFAAYTCGFVIEHNPLSRRFCGSAVFFHVAISDDATAGCIAASESVVRAYLQKLEAAKNPHILIE